MPKLDLVKTYKSYYKAGTIPEIVDLPGARYLTITGKGEPAGPAFVSRVEALYPLAYGVKKVCKLQDMDFGVPKLEGLWWVEGNVSAREVPRSEWCWKLLIRMPDYVTPEMVVAVQPDVAARKKNPLINEIRFEEIIEGQSAQVMHIGPYATEPETIDMLFAFIADNGLQVNGLHHEIYLSDPRKTAPEKLKTLIRYPVK